MSSPQICPSQRELDDLELLLSGALAPQTNFDDRVTLAVDSDDVEIVDPEGLPLARLRGGELTGLARPAYGPFRSLHLTPAEVAERWPSRVVVPVAAPLTESDLAAIQDAATGTTIVLLALTGVGTPQGVSAPGLVRATLAAAQLLPDAVVVAVPLASRNDPDLDHELGQRVAANYAAGQVLAVTGDGEVPEVVWDAIATEVESEPGLVVFFTGLSGSGKSTLARALLDRILEAGQRTATSLDGDVVRRNLSAGLTFSPEDRETNIRRIGWVAAEIARHGGIAICSPIAPFDTTRKAVREMVEDAGGEFVLVHVATPLEECERRDRKGLYAKARAGEIADFTGISSPYEEPADAEVVVDTTGRTIAEVLTEIVAALPIEPDAIASDD